jgi:hypothetical protein
MHRTVEDRKEIWTSDSDRKSKSTHRLMTSPPACTPLTVNRDRVNFEARYTTVVRTGKWFDMDEKYPEKKTQMTPESPFRVAN